MQSKRLLVRRYSSLTEGQWQWAIEQYELGYLNGVQLAHHFGVSKQGISAGLNKRGAMKGCRAFETVKELNQQISRNKLAREQVNNELWRKAVERHAIFAKSIEAMLVRGGIDPAEIAASGMFAV